MLYTLCVVGGFLGGLAFGVVFGFNMAYDRFDKILTKTFDNIKKAKNRERNEF